MKKDKIQKFKQRLLELKLEILEELDIESHNVIFNDSGDIADIASPTIENQVISQISDLDREKLGLIDKALEKIEDGTYGVCEGTGKKIPEARLNAIPWTPYTVEYAEQVEKMKKIRA